MWTVFWGSLYTGPLPFGSTTIYITHEYYENPNRDFRTFNYDVDTQALRAKLGWIDSSDPDLRLFRDLGKKLILWHGSAGFFLTPYQTVNFYNEIIADQAADPVNRGKTPLAVTQDFARLFLLPGVGHCSGGPGAGNQRDLVDRDMLTALEQWVEAGVPPERILASHTTGGVVDATRPLCAYPKVAVYKGSGVVSDAANWECRAPS